MNTSNKTLFFLVLFLGIITVLITFSLFPKALMADDQLPPGVTRFIDGKNVCYVYQLNNGGGLWSFDKLSNNQVAISCVRQ